MSTHRSQRNRAPVSVEPLEVRRLMSEGSFDNSFDLDGRALTGGVGGGVDVGTDVAVQRDGKTVVVGTSGEFQSAARYNANGSLDNGFGPFGTGFVLFKAGTASAKQEALSVAVAPDGKIVVGGRAGGSATIVRLTTAGALDPRFDGDGRVSTGSFKAANDIAVQPDGKVVAIGNDDGTFDTDIIVARFTTAGKTDDTFGSIVPGSNTIRFGYKRIGFDGPDSGFGLAINTHRTPATNPHFGKIYVTGRNLENDYIPPYGFDRRLTAARLHVNGDYDSSFDGDGKLTRSIGGQDVEGRAIAVRPDGGAAIVGNTGRLGSSTRGVVYSVTPTGGVDKVFGAGSGRVISDVGANEQALAAAYGGGDKIVVAGLTGNNGLVARFTTAGAPDPTFGTNGRTVVDFGGTDKFGGLALTNDGRLVAAGVGGAGEFAVARLFESVPTVAIGSFDPNAAEAGPNTASLLVTRDRRLPYPTRVYFSVGGTATRPGGAGAADYTGLTFDKVLVGRDVAIATARSAAPAVAPAAVPVTTTALARAGGLTGPIGVVGGIPGLTTRYFATIPANETFTVVTLTPADDALAEGTETATFTLSADAAYRFGTNTSATVTIADNDGPTATQSLRATADAFVRDGTFAAQNFGGAVDMVVKNGSAGPLRESYLKFDLSGVAAVNSARLRLYGLLTTPGLVQVQAFAVPNTTWTEGGLTFNNRPPSSGAALASVALTSTAGGFHEWDLTSYFRAEKLAGRNTVSVLLRSPIATDPAAIFASDEAATNRPELRVS